MAIPEAGLYLLCGCPADSVKHLMKRGLITTRETNGVSFETGPNAILLSDLLIQNGSFANLAEFPVLQMLYRQGLMIPGHPNNKNQKPLLIGSQRQVNAQMQYIYRGNYGLISEEEMTATGCLPYSAGDMMQMKLKFAFGKILPTSELLDTIILEGNPVEIKNGIMVVRKKLNIFEISYEDESVTIDLTLRRSERYQVPYALNSHNLRREYFGIIHSGQGDGWDVNRPCMSAILMFQGKLYLLDAEPLFLSNLIALGISVNEIEGIFHTHSHDDHFAGLPTLMRTDHKMKYFATPLVRASVTKKLCALLSIDETHFSDYFDVHDLEFNVWNNIEGLEVKPLFSPHPVETNIFVFRATGEQGLYSYGHFADIAALDVLEKMVAHNPLEPGISRDFFNRVKQDYLTTTNVKKIDIGGGYIHGNAEDFREDASEKILLAHTAIPLTEKQKEIGSGSQFGTVDTLIPAHQDYIWSTAFQLLQTNFPTIPEWDVKMLLNNSPILFNPQSIILKKGVFNTEIFMILTGNVERIDCESGTYSLLSSGAFVGETTETIGAPLNATYRTVNFVNALKIPIHLYLEVIKKNNLLHDLEQLRDNREFLQTTWLFGEALSYPTLNRIAKSLHHESYSPGHVFSQKEYASLHLITSGKIQRYIGEDIFETLVCGDTFGEEGALFKIPSVFQFRTVDHAEAYKISTDVLIDIPIVRWKLYEMFEKRIHSIIDTKAVNSPILHWRQEYSVHIHAMDKHHQTLFERANDFYMALDSQKDKSIIASTLRFLLEYTTYHFTEEEMLMKNYGFPGYENHRKKHAAFKKDIDALCAKFQENDPETGLELLQVLKNWILDHILTEDRKYGEFLNKKGVH